MLAKDTLEEFKLECELRRLTPRTIKGYYSSTLLHGIFQQNTIVDCSCTFLASEFIALIADKLSLQLKSSEVANF